MPHLFLDDWQWQFVTMDVQHDMRMPKRMDSYSIETATELVPAVFVIQASFLGIGSEDLPNAILGVSDTRIPVRIEQKRLKILDPEVSLSHSPFIPQDTGALVHQSSREMTGSHPTCFRVFSGEEDCAAIEIEVLELDADKLSHPAPKFVDHAKH